MANPSTGDDDKLNGVAAVSPTAVSAVGSFDDRSGSIPVVRTLAEQFNGTSWSIVPSGNVGTTDNLLSGAARMPGTTGAWAVGFRLTASGLHQTLVERARVARHSRPALAHVREPRLDRRVGRGARVRVRSRKVASANRC